MVAAGPGGNRRRGAAIKAAALGAFIVGAVAAVRFTPVKDLLTPEALGRILEASGIWAPLLFVAVYAAGVCLFVPGTLLTALGGALFGAWKGFLFVWLGAMAGAGASFWIGRTLGREMAASLIGDRLKKYDEAIERNGFATVLYLRLIYFPFTPLNFGMGLTRVRFRDFLAGTGLGIVVGTFIFVFLAGTLRDVWAGGDWSGLLSGRTIFAVLLFAGSFFIPKLVRKARGE